MAGFINTLAGGGSFLTVPLLVMLGLPPTVANGTNRLAVCAQTLAAVAGFRQEGVSGLGVAARARSVPGQPLRARGVGRGARSAGAGIRFHREVGEAMNIIL